MRLVEVLKNKFDMSISAPLPRGAEEDAKETALSDMIPYTVHYDDETFITKDDGLVQVIKIDGLHFESLTAEQIKQFEMQRNTVLRSIANSDRGLYVHLVRRRMSRYPEGDGQAWFSRAFNAAWRKRYDQRAFFVNDIYISIVQNRFRQGTPGLLDRVFAALSSAKPTHDDLTSFDDLAKQINEASNLLIKALSEYGARKLRIQRSPQSGPVPLSRSDARKAIERFGLSWEAFERAHGNVSKYARDVVRDFIGADISELASFFHYLVNLESERVPVPDQTLDRTLATSWIDAKHVSNLMTIENLGGTRAAAVLSMAEWPSKTSSRMLDDFLRQPVEFVLTQSFFFTDRISAEAEMRQEQRRMAVNDAQGITTEDQEDIKQGLRDLSRGKTVNGLHHLSMLVHVQAVTDGDASDNRRRTIARLDGAIDMLKKSFVGLGVKPVREWFGMETFFWSQLPGQAQHFIGRRGKIKSNNFAGFASLHNFATGKISGNLWGPAIMPFETESGTAYNFNFHRELEGMVAGHTAITADTGAGKTTLLSALIAMADKANPRVFWFDNREGAKVFMSAMGGKHTTLTAQGVTGWNPFQLPDTPESRAYLVDLQILMRTCYGGIASSEDIECFKRVVEENYMFANVRDRRLRNLSWCYGAGTELARTMEVWHGTGANAGVFDNATDNIDLAQCRYHCYEMRLLLKDATAARPELAVVLSYPFHRIEQAMNGEPFIIVLEEGQNLVKHPFWRERIDNYIMQLRRKNGLLVFVTPDAKYLYDPTDSIAKQTATKITLPNQNADPRDYIDHLGYTQAEFEFIKTTPLRSYKFLIRRGDESIRAVFDLSDLPEFIPVLSSNDKGVALMEAIKAELQTDDPGQWVPVFMQRAMEQNTHNLS